MGKTIRLGKAQRRAIYYAWTDRDQVLRLDTTMCTPRMRRSLERKGITAEWSYALTDLGRQVFEQVSEGLPGSSEPVVL